MIPNRVIARHMAENWRSLGVPVHDPRPNERMGSTDFGNVSQTVPGIHAYIAIAADGTAGHTLEFREASNSQAGQDGMLNSAKAMAMTTVELLNEPELMKEVKEDFALRAKR
jgi:metal-dependent amidase/aminoacylase/carboxypeptidase family protein